jgi:hypothetical protein
MTFGFISPKRRRVLRNLAIDEVSSVDRGAGHGVRVMLMKRDATPSATAVRKWDGIGTAPGADRGFRYVKEEPDMTMQERIAKSHTAAVRGEISFTQAALEQQQRALEMFPLAKSVGQALHQYGETAIGKRDIQALKDLQFLKSQWDGRLGNGAQAVMKSDDGIPRIEFEKAEPKVHADDSRDGAVANEHDSGVEEPFDRRVKTLMDKHGISHDAAVSMLHRAEKVSKGF